MKKNLPLLFLLLVGGFFFINNQNPTQPNPGAKPLTTFESTVPTSPSKNPTPTPTPNAVPKTLTIPKLNLQAVPIESVGLTNTGRMDIPSIPANVAWYKFGPPPGSLGSSVIAGHYDDPNGNPAPFYKLASLRAGDEVIVSTTSGSKTFVVQRLASFTDANFPINEVFTSSDNRAHLNLITCSGAWDAARKNYTERLVAFTIARD